MKIKYTAIVSILILSLVGCGNSQNQPSTLTVYAASSLTDAFDEIASAFEQEHPDINVLLNYGGSSQLALQIIEGAPAGVFASANPAQMQAVIDAGLIDAEPTVFARNRLTVLLPADNPAEIQSIADLASPGVQIIAAQEGVPIRGYTDRMLDSYAADEAFGEAFREGIVDNIISEEDNVRLVVSKIVLGEVDAGFVYASDVTPDIAEQVIQVDIPEAYNIDAGYLVAPLPGVEGAQTFIDFVLSPEGQAILVDWGFQPVEENVRE